MDVYVLTETGHVLGAGTDRSVCEDIADRRGDQWGAWRDAGGGVQERFYPQNTGDRLGRMVQRITRVPLAGMVAAGDLSAGLAAALKTEMTMQPITYDVPADHQTWDGSTVPIDDMRQAVGEDMARLGYKRFQPDRTGVELATEWQTIMQRIAREQIRAADESIRSAREIRVGDGAAWEWLKSALDQASAYPEATAYPEASVLPNVQVAAALWGMPVIRDPNIPGDEIRVGTVIYKIGTPGGVVAEGTMVRVDMGALGDPFTTPRG